MASSTTGHCLFFLALVLLSSAAYGQLSTTFYDTSCPTLQSTVRTAVTTALNNNGKRMGASLLRLFFHDCFVQGCDASILLDDVPATGFVGEKTANPNVNSVLGYNVINDIKTAVEGVCPGVVSCADIVTLAARDGVNLLGGPAWNVTLGRRDSTTANQSLANSDLPAPFSNLDTLISNFASKGLTATDLTALSGAHTIGMAQCKNYRDHIYNDNNINKQYANKLKSNCSSTAGATDTILGALDVQSPIVFDNKYFVNLVNQKALLHSDQELFKTGGSQNTLVQTYSTNQGQFNTDFVAAMIKLGDISPLTGTNGQIRTNCAKVN